MFIRENTNRSGSVSIQIVSKSRGTYRVIKTVGCATQWHELDKLKEIARQEIERLQFLETISGKFNLGKPVVVADAGLLTGKNIEALQEGGYCNRELQKPVSY